MGHFFIWLLLFGVIPWPSMSMSTGTANSEASLASVEPVQGSYGGAVLVTILGAGFSGDEYLGSNTVYLRTQLGHPLHNQECLVDEFYTRINRIVCLMPAYFGTSLETAALEGHSSNKDVWDAATDATITFDVFVEGTPVSSGSVLTYGYAAEATAYLMGIGHHAIQGSRLAFVGQFYSRNPQNYNVSIGPERCNMMQFLISPDGVALEKDAKWRHWHCAAMELEAGYYNVTIILEKDLLKSNEDPTLKMGQAVVTPRLLHDVYKMNSQGEVYVVAQAPSIDSVHPAAGSTNGGTLLTITGAGFSVDPAANTVTLGARTCDVLDASLTRLVCRTRPGPATPAPDDSAAVGVVGLRGLRHDTYADLTECGSAPCTWAEVSAAGVYPHSPDVTGLWIDDLWYRDFIEYGKEFRPTATVRNELQVLSGFFVPPYTSASYRFYAWGNDFVRVELSSVPYSTAEGDMAVVASVDDSGSDYALDRYWTGSGNVDSDARVSGAISLQAGQPYYMKVYHGDAKGEQYWSVAMSHEPQPAVNPAPFSTVPYWAYVRVTSAGTREQYTVDLSDPALSGASVTVSQTLDTGDSAEDPLDLPTDATTLRNLLRDQAGGSTDSGGGISVWEDSSTANKFYVRYQRPPAVERALRVLFDDANRASQTHAPSPVVEGTFTVTLAGQTYTLTHDPALTNCEKLTHNGVKTPVQDILAAQLPDAVIEVGHGGNAWGCTWRMRIDAPGAGPDLAIALDSHTLTGDAVQIDVGPVLGAKGQYDHWYYDPLPAEFLRVALPQDSTPVLVTTNGMTAAANTTNVTEQPTFEVRSDLQATLTSISPPTVYHNDTLTLVTSGVSVDEGDIRISFISDTYGSPLAARVAPRGSGTGRTLTQTQNDTFACDDVTLSAGTIACVVPMMPAGTYAVDIDLAEQGWPLYQSTAGLQPVASHGLSVASLAPDSGSPYGGTNITITGQGFPAGSGAAAAQVLVDGAPCLLLDAVSYTKIICQTPPSSSAAMSEDRTVDVEVLVGGKTATAAGAFRYVATGVPAITSVTPTTMSAACGALLTITGTGFQYGLALTVGNGRPSIPFHPQKQSRDATVFLCDAESRCYLCPTETANATRLTCRAGRVPNATYTVRLTQPQRGFAGPAFTVDALFLINGVSPASGSTAGGALLTLTGRGFCDGVVLMAGPTREQGLDCAPQYMSDAEMQCRLQDNWRTYAGAHTLRLYADNDEAIRNGVHAACDAAVCVHEFAAAATPTITGATGLTGNAGDVLTLTGTGLAGHSANVTVGDVECAPAAGTDTELQCALAGVGVAGPGHTIAVMVNPQGLAVWTGAAAAATYHFALRVTAFAPASGSLGGGLALTIEGQGFGPSAAVTLVGAGPCPVLGRSRTYLVCRTPPAAAAGGHAVRVDVGNSSATAAGQFQFQTGLTPQAASLSPGTGTLGTVLTIGGTGLADVNVSVAGTECDVTANTATSVTCTLGPVPGTTAPVRVASAHGWAVNAFPDFVSTLSVASVAPATTSFVGGTRLTVAGVGFTGAAEDISFTVCGAPAAVLSTEYGQAVIETPPLVTLHTLAAYMPDAEPYQLAATAIGPNSAAVFDGDVSSHGTVTSYVGMDMGPLAKAWLTALWFFPRLTGQDSRVQMMEAKPSFQVSNDSVTWEDIPGLTALAFVALGWNKFEDLTVPPAQYVRLTHSGSTPFDLVELRFYGYVLNSTDGVDCAVDVSVNTTDTTAVATATLAAAVTYASGSTPVVTAISPASGTAAGAQTVVLTGTGFTSPQSLVTVKIDGIDCVVQSSTGTSITCITGYRPAIVPDALGMVVWIAGVGEAALQCSPYMYIDPWSSPLTWRDGLPPVDGDLVVLPKGRNVLLDIDTPKLLYLLIEGTLIVDDTQDVELHSTYIFVRGGTLQAGTEAAPHQHTFRITLYGDRYTTPHFPIYGAKNLAMRGGLIALHGVPRTPVWTRLAATAAKGAKSITVRQPTDWQRGEWVVIAPSHYFFYEAERRQIQSVSPDGRTIHFKERLLHNHYGEIYTAAGRAIDMSSEVGLLDRNLQIEGDADSWKQSFGGHCIFHSPGRHHKVEMEYVQLQRMGQKKLLGRYPIHFHLEKNVENSYVRGCAIHDTFNRAVVVHDSNHLLIEANIAYNTRGHAFFTEDGNERFNTFKDNLGMMSNPASSQLAHDVFPSTFWIANPLNNLIGNAAAGSSHLGFWIAPPQHPRQASVDETQCPFQSPLGTVVGNTAHSNGRHGFWVHEEHYARQHECGDDNEVANPFIASTITNLTAWKNLEQGLGLTKIAKYVIDGTVAVDNGDAGIEIGDVGGYRTTGHVLVTNSLLVAHSDNEPERNRPFRFGYRGILTPKSEGLTVENVTFVGYNSESPRHFPVYACCRCWNDCDSEKGAYTTFFKGVTYVDSPYRYRFGWPFNNIFVDLDGSFTSGVAGGGLPLSTAVPNMPHLRMPDCTNVDSMSFPSGLVCPNTYRMHRVELFGARPYDYVYHDWTVQSSAGAYDQIPDISVNHGYTNGWAFPVASGPAPASDYTLYSATWQDWEYLRIWVDDTTDLLAPLYLHFNYTIRVDRFHAVPRFFSDSNTARAMPLTSQMGDPVYYNLTGVPVADDVAVYVPPTAPSVLGYTNKLQQKMSLMFTQEHRITPLFDIDAIPCPPAGCCPDPYSVADTAELPFSSAAAWEYGADRFIQSGNAVPQEGDCLLIPQGRTVVLDYDPPRLNRIIVRGKLRFDDSADRNLTVRYLIVQGGELEIGTASSPFQHNARITLFGGFGDKEPCNAEVQDFGAATLAIFGTVSIYGAQTPSWTHLQTTAAAGDSAITLTEAVAGQWRPGDEILLPSTDTEPNHYETAVVQSVSGSTVTLEAPLQYRHYAGTQTIGGTDVTVRGEVGLLSKNVVIEGEDASPQGWGCTVFFSQSHCPEIGWFSGQGTIKNAEIRHGGRYRGGDAAVYVEKYDPLDWLGTAGPVGTITLEGVSIHPSKTTALRLEKATAVRVKDCVIFDSQGRTVDVLEAEGNEFTGNLIGGMHDNNRNPSIESMLCAFHSSAMRNVITDNVVAGSESEGWCVPLDDCAGTRYLGPNTAHSCLWGFYGSKDGSDFGNVKYSYTCALVQDIVAYSNAHTGIVFQVAARPVVRNVVLLDNHIGVSIQSSWSHGSNVARLENSIIAPTTDISGGACPLCFTFYKSQSCADRVPTIAVGVELSWFRSSTKTFQYPKPSKVPINKPKPKERVAFHGRLEVTGCTLAHFSAASACNPRAFATNGWIVDHIVPTFLSAMTVVNSDPNAMLFIHENDIKNRHLTCCGPLDCEALLGVWLRDTDGTTFGAIGDALSYKVGMAPGGGCSVNTAWNAYWCPAPMSHGMIYVKNLDDDAWERYVMPLRFWKLDGNGERLDPQYPMTVNNPPDAQHPTEWPTFMRQPFFWPIVETGAVYEMDFGDYAPRNTFFHLRHCTGKVVLGVWYQEMYSVQVWVGSSRVPESEAMPTVTSEYGRNHYVMNTRRIWFTLQCDSALSLEVHQLPTVKVAVRLEIDVNNFYEAEQDAFVSGLALLLGIDSTRIKIVDIQPGSAIVTFEIVSEDIPPNNGTNASTTLVSVELTHVADQVTAIFNNTGNYSGVNFSYLTDVLGVPVSADSLVGVTVPQPLGVPVIAAGGCNTTLLNSCTSPAHGRCMADPERCQCKWGWWGPDCGQYHCAHRRLCSGHGACGGPNECVCLPEWTGPDCGEPIAFNLTAFVVGFGDLHLRTYDGADYVFNSIGEFYLHKAPDVTLQARLERCGPGAACLTQVAVQYRGGGRTDTVLFKAPTIDRAAGAIAVALNGAALNASVARAALDTMTPDGRYVAPGDLTAFYVEVAGHDPAPEGEDPTLPQLLTAPEPPAEAVLPSGMSLDVDGRLHTLRVPGYGVVRLQCDVGGYLVVAVAAAEGVRATPHGGLYGTFSNATHDDFTLPDGAVLAAPTPADVHAVFGEAWRLPSADSYFEYGLLGVADGYSALNDLSFRPQLATNFTSQALEVVAVTACLRLGLAGPLYAACLFDVATTGDVRFATAAATAAVLVACADACNTTALDACPLFCSVRGTCVHGACVCDPGFSGAACEAGSEALEVAPLTFPADEPINPNNIHWLSPLGPPSIIPECCAYSRWQRCRDFPLHRHTLTICQCSCRHPFEGRYCDHNPRTGGTVPLGSTADVPARACRDVHYCRADLPPGADAAVFLRETPADAARPVTCRAGGWTPFFNGTSGSAHVFARFNTHESAAPDETTFLRRVPMYLTTSTRFAAQCGGAMVRFHLNSVALWYFQNGTVTEAGVQSLYHVAVEAGQALHIPTHIHIDAHGFALTRQADPTQTFGSSWTGASGSDTTYDYCNGVAGAGAFTLWYQ